MKIDFIIGHEHLENLGPFGILECPVQGQELNSIISVSPFQIRRFHDTCEELKVLGSHRRNLKWLQIPGLTLAEPEFLFPGFPHPGAGDAGARACPEGEVHFPVHKSPWWQIYFCRVYESEANSVH